MTLKEPFFRKMGLLKGHFYGEDFLGSGRGLSGKGTKKDLFLSGKSDSPP